MRRSYTRKAPRIKEENPLGAGGTSRGTISTRGKKKRASADLDARTIVASNPFDDDDHQHQQQQHHHQQQQHHIQHQQVHPMHAHPQLQPHPHQPFQHPHQTPPTQHHSPAPQVSPYGAQMGQPVQAAAYPQQMSGGLMPPQPPHLQTGPPQHPVESPMQPGLVGTPTPPPQRVHPMYGFQGADGYQMVSQPPPPLHQAPQGAPLPPPQQQQPQHQPPPMMHQMEATGQPPIAPYQPAAQAPPMVYCGECRQAIYANEARIVCRAGCDYYYHRLCSGLTELACELLLREPAAEWACNRCINSNRQIPVVRLHNQQADCRQLVWGQS